MLKGWLEDQFGTMFYLIPTNALGGVRHKELDQIFKKMGKKRETLSQWMAGADFGL